MIEGLQEQNKKFSMDISDRDDLIEKLKHENKKLSMDNSDRNDLVEKLKHNGEQIEKLKNQNNELLKKTESANKLLDQNEMLHKKKIEDLKYDIRKKDEKINQLEKELQQVIDNIYID